MALTFENILAEINKISPAESPENRAQMLTGLFKDESFTALSPVEINRIFMYLCFRVHECTPLLDKLIQLGADPHYREEDQNYLNRVFRITFTKPNYRYKFSPGLTPLMCAAFSDHSRVMQFLISKKVEINAATQSGMTALLYAASAGSTEEVFQQLIKAGANVNAMSFYGNEQIELANKGDLNPEELGKTALMLAVQTSYKGRNYKSEDGRKHRIQNFENIYTWGLRFHIIEVVKCLLKAGAEVDIKSKLEKKDFEGQTAFGIAIELLNDLSGKLYQEYESEGFCTIKIVLVKLLLHGADLKKVNLSQSHSVNEIWEQPWLFKIEDPTKFTLYFIQEVLKIAQLNYHAKSRANAKNDPWITDKNQFEQCIYDLIGKGTGQKMFVDKCKKILGILKYDEQLNTGNSNSSTSTLTSISAAAIEQKQGTESDALMSIEENDFLENDSTAESINLDALKQKTLNWLTPRMQAIQLSIEKSIEYVIFPKKYAERVAENVRREKQPYTGIHQAFLSPGYYGVLNQLQRQKPVPMAVIASVAQFLHCSTSPVHHKACLTLHYDRFKTFESHFGITPKARTQGNERKKFKINKMGTF